MSPQWELVYSLRLPDATVPNEVLRRWQRLEPGRIDVYQQQLQGLVLEAVAAKPKRPLHACRIHVERAGHERFPDAYEDLLASLKPLLDVLSCPRGRKPYGLGFIVDDSPQYLQRLTAESVVAPKGKGYTHVYIYRPAAGTQRRAA